MSTSKLSKSRTGAGGLEAVEVPGLLTRDQPDLDQVERADEPVADAEASRSRDRVPQRDGPMVLEQDERGGRVVGDVLEHVPGLRVGQGMDPLVGRDLGASRRAGRHSVFALDTQADQSTHLGAELDGLVTGQVAQVLNLDLSGRVLVDGQRVDHAHGVGLAEPFELSDDLPVEVRLVEAQYEKLNWSD